jgi:DNA invertase Pin-like site-specific DNA recombinase
MDATIRSVRAAQYVRMSTDQQRYSIEHQSRTISAYAADRGFEIVRTYADVARSGLRIKGRPALAKLIADVVAGGVDFSTILVLDVSRWGRFQDLDEAAHYEFICRSADVDVRYCAEPFENDGSMHSAIIKQLKRVMAAEYSRELSVKVSTAQRGLAQQGYRLMGSPGYGLRRLILDETGAPAILLEPGQRKAIHGHRIMLVPGPPDEVATVRRIYRLRLERKQSLAAIARTLNAEGVMNEQGRPWKGGTVKTVLTNEKYVGNNVFGRLKGRLGETRRPTPPETWVRCQDAFPALVDRKLFRKAVKAAATPLVAWSEEQLLQALRDLWARAGFLSIRLMEQSPDTPCINSYYKRFGTLSEAYRLIGYDRRTALRERHRHLSDDEMLGRLAELLAERGRLSPHTINGAYHLPAAATYIERFGDLFEAYRLIGYFPKRTGYRRPRKAYLYDDDGMTVSLRALFARAGRLSASLIDADPNLPCYPCVARHLGPIRQLYACVGAPYQRRCLPPRKRGKDGRFRDSLPQ